MEITLAVDRYDRHFPFFDGSLSHDFDLDIKPFQVGQSAHLQHGTDRHESFLRGQYDVAEFSMSSFLAAKTRGYPIVGIPVFPRRLFSTSQMWVSLDSQITEPSHLIGRSVALSAFQTTLSLLAKGDLGFHYEVPWRSIHWKLTTKEKIPLEHGPDVSIEFIGERDRLGDRLHSGEIDAFFLPHPPANVMSGEIPARRLFLDPELEEERYFDEVGSFPIMHVIAIQESLANKSLGLPLELMEIFHSAFDIAEGYYEDGQLRFNEAYLNGELNGPHEIYYENGQLLRKSLWLAGELHGPVEDYYENGQLQQEATFVNGELQGTGNGYYENGQLEWTGMYKDNEQCGEWIEDGEAVTYDPCPSN